MCWQPLLRISHRDGVTGLQNINWIPKVTPLPSVDFDIIQPVLQYPGACFAVVVACLSLAYVLLGTCGGASIVWRGLECEVVVGYSEERCFVLFRVACEGW